MSDDEPFVIYGVKVRNKHDCDSYGFCELEPDWDDFCEKMKAAGKLVYEERIVYGPPPAAAPPNSNPDCAPAEPEPEVPAISPELPPAAKSLPAPAPDGWPSYRCKTARELADSVFPVSEEVILQAARKHNIGRKFGRVVLFSRKDAKALYEALPCPSSSLSSPKVRTGTSGAPSASAALQKALKLTTGRSPKKSEPNERVNFTSKQSTVVALRPRSRKRP